ncbi:hypothetical protein BUY47_12155, partial [Staphylococcus devriesei]
EDFKLPTTGEPANFLTPNRALADLIQQKDMTYSYQEFDGGHNLCFRNQNTMSLPLHIRILLIYTLFN